MSDLVPSYVLKIDRAVEHLNAFKEISNEYVSREPYTVISGREKGKEIHRLKFTSQIDPRAKMIAADLIYNVRSGLDHLATALNPPRMKRSVMFPIFSEGIWEDCKLGESDEQTKSRERWNTSTREMKPGAIQILKGLQPPESARDDAGKLHLLVLLNRLSNKDRHTDLPLMPVGLSDFAAKWQLPGSDQWFGGYEKRHWGMVEDNAIVGAPEGARNVKVTGTAKLAIRASGPDWEVEVPVFFDNLINLVRDHIFTPLFPFLYMPATKK